MHLLFYWFSKYAPHGRQTHYRINIEGKAIEHIDSFDLQQHFNGHHYFELQFKNKQLDLPRLITLDNSRDFVGKTLTASFGHQTDEMQEFIGLVTKISIDQSHGYHGVFVLSGYSPSILIDRGADLGSYLAKNFEEVVTPLTKDIPENDLKIVTNTNRKVPIDYLIQSKESDFQFLDRLSAEYQEWFFYDGKQLNFGKPDEQEEIELFYVRFQIKLLTKIEATPLKHCSNLTAILIKPPNDKLKTDIN